jgi:hypothetical protein
MERTCLWTGSQNQIFSDGYPAGTAFASESEEQICSARLKAETRDGTMQAQELGAVDEELTARMSVKLAGAVSQKFDRRVRVDERGDFKEYEKLHNRQKSAGGGRDSGH